MPSCSSPAWRTSKLSGRQDDERHPPNSSSSESIVELLIILVLVCQQSFQEYFQNEELCLLRWGHLVSLYDHDSAHHRSSGLVSSQAYPIRSTSLSPRPSCCWVLAERVQVSIQMQSLMEQQAPLATPILSPPILAQPIPTGSSVLATSMAL